MLKTRNMWVALWALAGLVANAAHAAASYRVVIGGGVTGSAAYLEAGLMAEYIRKATDISATPHPSGFIENLRLVERKELELGLTATSLLYEAINSKGAFASEPRYQNIRALFPVHAALTQWVTYRRDIQNLRDLAGRRVNVGPPAAVLYQFAELTLKAAGVWDKVRKEFVSLDAGLRLMQDGRIDAITVTGPYPFPTVQEAAAAPGRQLRFVEIPEDALKAVTAENPWIQLATIPAGAYGPGLPPASLATVGYTAYLIAHKDVPEFVIYQIMRALLSEEGRKHLLTGYAPFQTGFDVLPGFDALARIGVPLHDGAVRYWREQGVRVPDELAGRT